MLTQAASLFVTTLFAIFRPSRMDGTVTNTIRVPVSCRDEALLPALLAFILPLLLLIDRHAPHSRTYS